MEETTRALAGLLHDQSCYFGPRCRRWTEGSDLAHYGHYRERAVAIINGLEPMIGIANVIPCVRVVLDEVL